MLTKQEAFLGRGASHDHRKASQSQTEVIDEGLFMSFHSNKEKNINK